MELNLSSLEDFTPSSSLDLSGLDDSDTPKKTSDETKTPKPTLNLSGLEDLFPSERENLEAPPAEVRSRFGNRKDPFLGTTKFHNGIDYKYPLNTPVKSLGRGAVIDVGDSGKKNYGKYVTVDYGGGLEITYGHLNQQKVEVGDRISSEAIVGLSGNTGRSKAPHLHIKAMLNGEPVDPSKYFSSSAHVVDAITSDKDVVSTVPKLNLSGLALTPVEHKLSREQISVSGADIIHHLGFDPNKVDSLNPSIKAHLISTVKAAVESDKTKREAGQKDFPISFSYQNGMRKKVGLPQMSSVMQQYSPGEISNPKNLVAFTNHTMFPTVYNIASTVSPLTQEVHRNNLIENRVQELRKDAIDAQKSLVKGDYRPTSFIDEKQIREMASREADEQLAFEEQQHLDATSKTATFTKNVITAAGAAQSTLGSYLPGLKNEDITRGFARTVVGGTLKQFGNLLDLIPGDSSQVGENNPITRFGSKIQAGAELQAQENPIDPYSYGQNLQRGIGEGVGASPELIKLFAGAELLKAAELPAALNLPAQGAISGLDKGLPGIIEGVKGGLIYHYGGAITGPYLGRIGNSLLWIAGPTAESHLLGGKDLATSIGEAIPTGLFVGITGGERVKVIDSGRIRSANMFDADKIASGELSLVPPTFRTAMKTGRAIEELSRQFGSIPLNIEVPKTGFTIEKPTAQANLELLDLKNSLRDETFKQETDTPEQVETKKENINLAIASLEKAIPEDVRKFYEDNEDAIRSGINTEKARKAELAQQPIYKDGKLREDIGASNNGTSKDRAEEILNNFTKISNRRLEVNLPFAPGAGVLASKVADLGYLTAFFAEDFYHRGVEPSISLVGNKVRETLGEFGQHLKDDVLKDAYERGINYFNANQADPFFSRMKQDAAEKLPNRFTAEQAKNILSQHVDEFEWTAGLQDFINENADKKISKKDLIDIINQGQVRVEANVADDSHPDVIRLKEINRELELTSRKIDRQIKAKEPTGAEQIKYGKLTDEKNALIDKGNINQVKYSLKAHTSEKLELPGAKDSKEVKLITPLVSGKENWEKTPDGWRYIGKDKAITGYPDLNYGDEVTNIESYLGSSINKYTHSHWGNLANVVAHYRSTFRTTLDNLRLYFSEEFQSDWNHDIRTKGLRKQKISLENWPKEFVVEAVKNPVPEGDRFLVRNTFNNIVIDSGKTVEEAKDAAINWYNTRMTEGTEPNPFMGHAWKELVFKRFLRDGIVEKRNYQVEPTTITVENNDVYSKHTRYVLKDNEEVFQERGFNKLFQTQEEAQKYLEENNLNTYKHDGIGWTTARQQAERYGGILEGKSFKWKKNSDETYSFDFLRGSNEYGNVQDDSFYESPHELKNISLERFAELTTKEAAQEVRDQEAKYEGDYWTQRDVRRLKTLNKLLEGESESSYIYKDAWDERNKLIQKEKDYHTPRTNGKFSLKEAVELRGGMGTWADYDVALVNIAKKLGKRFGAKYSTKEVETKQTNVYLGPEANIEQVRIARDQYFPTASDFDTYNALDRLYLQLGNGTSMKKYITNLFNSSRGQDIKAAENILQGLYGKERSRGLVGTETKKEQIHYLEITPSMRASLEKEGLPLYGLGGNEKLTNPETGIRNKITSSEAFDEHRNTLTKALEEASKINDLETKAGELMDRRMKAALTLEMHPENIEYKDLVTKLDKEIDEIMPQINPYEGRGNIFNSGLSPDAFIDQTILLYKGLKDFGKFSKEMIERFTEVVKPFLQDLWAQAKNYYNNFNSEPYKKGYGGTFSMGLDLTKIDPRNIGLTKKRAAIEYLTDPTKHQGKITDYRFIVSATGLAQFEPKFAEPYNDLVKGQRATNRFNSFVLDSVQSANKSLKNQDHDQVGRVLYNGLVEEGKVFSRTDLLVGNTVTGRPALSVEQADAYQKFYQAQHLSLDLRRETILHDLRERLARFNAQLAAAPVGSTAAANALKKKTAVQDNMDKIKKYYDRLKKSGYFSLQRYGPIAAYIENAAGEKVYKQFEDKVIGRIAYKAGLRKAQNWIDEQIATGANASTQSIYDVRKSSDISSLAKKLSIGAFEDLVDSSGVGNTPEIQKLRDEVYTQFSSKGYELKRDFTLGYDRTWESAVSSMLRQAELYSSSFYSRVSKAEAEKSLTATGLQKSDPNLHQLAKAYIEDETIFTDSAVGVKALGKARQAVYAIKLGYDVSQLYLNAFLQPITQTYNYFARVKDASGNRLKGAEPEAYFARGAKLSLDLARDRVNPGQTRTVTTPSGTITVSNRAYATQNFLDFKKIYTQLVAERIVAPEFSKSLLEIETDTLGKNLTQTSLQKATSAKQHLHWAGFFMRAGERVTRTHVAAEAFLVGKEKFNLSGDKLIDFIVQAVNATQSNPTRGDNPWVARRTFGASAASSEAGKLFYQFNKFNQMWVENVALNAKADFEQTWNTTNIKDLPANIARDLINNKARALIRTAYPLLIVGGLRGLPLAGLAWTLYTYFSGNDPKDKFDKAFKDHKTMEAMALYGVTGSAGVSRKSTPSIPFVDTLGTEQSTVPLYSAADQIIRGMYNLSPLSDEKDYQKGIEQLAPSAVSRLLKARRYYADKMPVGGGKRKPTNVELAGQVVGITPTRILESFEKNRAEQRKKIHKKLVNALR